ncbi:hypothetical protein AAHL06_004525 [Vibrio parahaemolyticus]|nr:hypothetical protein [Vibrio parahaemolyticus]EJZ8378361.1 hypothetical protein [Vibrio parahaemolyticus]EKC8022279.1 hypothetical protein [Vibrio parahaemolyticus]ELA4963213.1 hypothetical protein [Vibrio parahaemolyticus]ELA6055710.1 hypothetical protein [Vibrio parahaemolyticus]
MSNTSKDEQHQEKADLHSIDSSVSESYTEYRSPALQVYRNIVLDLFKGFEFILICMIIIIAIFSIYNISARETLSKSIETKINSLNSEFVTSNRMVLLGQINEKDQADVAKQLNEISNLEVLSSQVHALKAYGGNEQLSLSLIKSEFIASKQRELEYPSDSDTVVDLKSSSTRTFWESSIDLFTYMSSDVLLAFSLLSCGALGAVIASLRNNSNVDLSKFTIGFATGFVTFLGIKGGQFVFLLQVPGAASVLNPYTASFIALLSGMFSERFHLILAGFIDKATDKISER